RTAPARRGRGASVVLRRLVGLALQLLRDAGHLRLDLAHDPGDVAVLVAGHLARALVAAVARVAGVAALRGHLLVPANLGIDDVVVDAATRAGPVAPAASRQRLQARALVRGGELEAEGNLPPVREGVAVH